MHSKYNKPIKMIYVVAYYCQMRIIYRTFNQSEHPIRHSADNSVSALPLVVINACKGTVKYVCSLPHDSRVRPTTDFRGILPN